MAVVTPSSSVKACQNRLTNREPEEEEGCYMGHTSDHVATEPWMYGKEDPCAGPGWRNREPDRCVTGQSSDYVATDPRKEGVEGWKGL
jgi:hypothetical protein